MIKIAFSLFIAALMLFAAAKALSFNPLYLLGALALLTAFALIALSLMSHALRSVALSLGRYFSAAERQRRRHWFTLGRLEQTRLFALHRRRQQRYFYEREKKRLTRANDLKHSRTLAKAIERDLRAVAVHAPKDQLDAWRRQYKLYRRSAHIEGLIALQQTLLAYRHACNA